MTATEAQEFAVPRGRKLAVALRRTMARDEFFAALAILACANGLFGRILLILKSDGWTGLVTGEISWILLFACFAGISLLLQGEREEIRAADFWIALVFLALVALPIFSLSWVALTGLGLYILLVAKRGSARWRGAMILLALTVAGLGSTILMQLFPMPILAIDASLASSLLGTDRVGNMVGFGDGSGRMVVTPACSSFGNLALGFICFVSITQWANHRWRAMDFLWCGLAIGSVIAVNVVRIALTGLSQANYKWLHSPEPEAVAGNIILGLVVGFSLLSVRRELFSRA
jgi:exosortase/archaeosortase family protein